MNDSKHKDTKIVFVISPVYGETTNHLLSPFKDLIQKYDITLLDHFSDDSFIHNKQLFADKVHLNKEGASLFSDIISREIKAMAE